MELLSFLILTVCVIMTTTLLTKYIQYARTWSSSGIPSVMPLPLIGNFKNVLLMKQQPAELFEKIYKSFKNPMIGMFVFHKPALLIKDPDVIRSILVKDFNHFPDRMMDGDTTEDILGTHNLLAIKNPDWRQMRTKLTPLFTSGKIKQMFSLMNEVGEELADYVEGLAVNAENKNNNHEFREICAKYTTDVIATCAYGIKANSLKNEQAEFRNVGRNIFEYSWKRAIEMSSMFFFPELAKLFKFKFFGESSSKFLRNTMWDVIKTREDSGAKRNDLIDVLIKLKNAKTVPGEIKFEGDTLVAQAAIFFTGGFETTSSTMSYTLYELCLHPDIQDKVRAEIKTTLEENDGKFTYDSVMSMPYLHMVVSETLRKYPPVLFLDRVCANVNGRGYRLPHPHDDVVIPSGTPVYIPVLSLHMDEQYYPNPERYDPERFSEKVKRERNPYTYLPFGTGPHNCIGERFGLLQTKIGLAYLLKNHAVVKSPETRVPLVMNPRALLMTPIGGIQMSLIKVH